MKRTGYPIVRLLFLLLVSLPWAALADRDVGGAVERLGNPLKEAYPDGEAVYSRNVWDLQRFDGRIFIGGGNSSNEGPSQNAGPVPIFAYDLKNGVFVNEGRVMDEQIDIYRPIGDRLYIPGHDATGSWEWGNFYVRTPDAKWKMYRNVPKALHLYDLVEHDGRLFAGIGLYEGAAVGITEDMGMHWRIVPLGRSRVYAFMPIGDMLLALKKFKDTDKPYFSAAQYLDDGNFSARFDISMRRMFPQTRFTQRYARAVRVTPVGDSTLYIGGYKYNDHQTLPFGLYVAELEGGRFSAQRIALPEGTVPHDLLLRDGKVFLLTHSEAGKSKRVEVWEASERNLLQWKPLFYFTYPAFARSFEYDRGSFYFGTGCDIDPEHWSVKDMPVQTGDILKVIYEEER